MAEDTALSQLGEAHRKLADAHAELQEKYSALEAKHAEVAEALHTLRVELGMVKQEYMPKEGDSKCGPVPPGGKCDVCGWEHGGKEPHPIRA